MLTRNFLAVLILSLVSLSASAQDEVVSALTCQDFRPTPEALQRFPDLIGACESVVERDGELYGKFTAVVRRANSRGVTLYLPATDHTFSVEPDEDARVEIGGRKVRPGSLDRGDEISIYLSASSFARPDVQEVVLVTESDALINHSVTSVDALPTTASSLPALGLLSLGLIGFGYILRRRAA